MAELSEVERVLRADLAFVEIDLVAHEGGNAVGEQAYTKHGPSPHRSPRTSSPGLRLLALPPGLKPCEPKALRYRFLQVPARLTHSARQCRLRFPRTSPRAHEIVAAFTAIRTLTPLRT